MFRLLSVLILLVTLFYNPGFAALDTVNFRETYITTSNIKASVINYQYHNKNAFYIMIIFILILAFFTAKGLGLFSLIFSFRKRDYSYSTFGNFGGSGFSGFGGSIPALKNKNNNFKKIFKTLKHRLHNK